LEKNNNIRDIYFYTVLSKTPLSRHNCLFLPLQVRIPDLSNFRPFPTAPFPVVSLTHVIYTLTHFDEMLPF